METVTIANSDVAYIQSAGIVFTSAASKKQEKASTPIIKEVNGVGMANWGGENSNTFPQEVIVDVKKNIELSQGISFYTFALVGSGLVYGTTKIDDNTGEDKLIRKIDPEVEAFFKNNHIVDFQTSVAYNFKTFWNVFKEVVLNQDRSKIIGVKCHKSHHCRLSKMNQSSGIIEKVFINTDWENEKETSERTLTIPLIDKSYMPVESLRMRKDGFRYIYSFSGPGTENYYQIAPWNAIRESKWLEVVAAIPVFKAALMKNQMMIRYHVQIPDYYWSWKYPNFESLKAEERKEKIEETHKEIAKFLTGAENAGKNLFSTYKFDESLKKEFPGVKIEHIQNQSFSGEYLPDSAEGAQKIYHALDIDSTIMGTLPGKGQSAGSGSDKSVAWNLFMAKTRGEQQLQLQFLDFVAEYNGWNKRYEKEGGLRFEFKNSFMARLMDVSPSDRNK